MVSPTWGELVAQFCSVHANNPHYEDFATRRYNFAASDDKYSCRLIFLKDVLQDKSNKTLCRHGRFVWCRNLRYEGRTESGLRSVSFTVDKGNKRFNIAENNILCLPSSICVSNNRYFKSKQKTFLPFSSVFSYAKSFNLMVKNSDKNRDSFLDEITKDNPYKPGTLVVPRLGYFQPQINPEKLISSLSLSQHPCGIILGRSAAGSDAYVTREFYRVRFGDTTYERVHPVQMEIINEV